MKKGFLFFITLILVNVTSTKAQFVFSVTPGIQLNAAAFGYSFGKLVPYAGLQVLNQSITEITQGKEFDSNGNVIDVDRSYKVSATLYVPTIGTKYFIKETGNLKMYGNLLFAYFIPSVNIKDSEDPQAEQDFKKHFQKAHLFGGQLGFGTEYFFDENFSLGGEFGFRDLYGSYQEKYDYESYNPNTGQYVSFPRTYKYKLNLNTTYIRISFNFYFKGQNESK